MPSDRSTVSDRTTTTATHFSLDEAEGEEEEPEQLFRRYAHVVFAKIRLLFGKRSSAFFPSEFALYIYIYMFI